MPVPDTCFVLFLSIQNRTISNSRKLWDKWFWYIMVLMIAWFSCFSRKRLEDLEVTDTHFKAVGGGDRGSSTGQCMRPEKDCLSNYFLVLIRNTDNCTGKGYWGSQLETNWWAWTIVLSESNGQETDFRETYEAVELWERGDPNVDYTVSSSCSYRMK